MLQVPRQPSFEIHAAGEADGDLTWFKTLSPSDQRLIREDGLKWNKSKKISIESNDHTMNATIRLYKEAFQAADDDQDGFLTLEGLKKFFLYIHANRISQGFPSKDPADTTDQQW